MSVGRSPGWVRAAEIILGILTIILSVFALAFPGATFLSAIVILSIILFFVGIEKIITGIFLPQRSKAATIGLGVLVLIFAGLAIAFPAATAFVALVFIGVALLFGGCARIAEGLSGQHSGWNKFFLIGSGALAVILSIPVMVLPVFGAKLAGIVVAIALLILGIQMVAAGVAGQRFRNPADKYLHAE